MRAERSNHSSANSYFVRSIWLPAPTPDCTSSHLFIPYLDHSLFDALQCIVDAVLFIVLAFTNRPCSLAHFDLEIIK